MMPRKTLASKEEDSALGYKKSKDWVLLLIYANSHRTDKLPLLLSSANQKLGSFKNINVNIWPIKEAYSDELRNA